MCYRYNTNLDGHIADELYDRVKMALFPLAARVVFSCRAGEPTLYPKWNRVVQDVADYGIQGGLVTNATVLNSERIRQLVDGNFVVRFSVDGAASRTYQYVRGFPLSTVARNIQEFISYRSSKKRSDAEATTQPAWPPMTGVNFTPMMLNVRETPDMVDLIADWGVEALFVQKFSSNNAYTSQSWSPETDPEAMKQIYDEAARRAERRGVTLVIADTVRYQPPDKRRGDPIPEMPHLGCARPFSDAVVNQDGGVLPCCFGAPPMGYLQYQTFDEIWNGEAWRELRRGLVEGDPPAYCRKCHLLKSTGNGHKTSPFISIQAAVSRLRDFSHRVERQIGL